MLKKQSRAQMPMFSFPPDLNGLHGFWNFPCSHYMLNEAFLFTSCCALQLGRSLDHPFIHRLSKGDRCLYPFYKPSRSHARMQLGVIVLV